jgi:hypothetical protein
MELVLADPLRSCVFACETYCVAGCCGLEAFDLGIDNVRAWAKDRPATDLAQARRQLAEWIALVEGATETVHSDELNVLTDPAYRGELLAWLRALESSLRALAVHA